MIKSLVVEFDQANYEEFLSSGSKSPRAQQYRKVSSEIRSQVPLEASPNVVCAKNIMAGRITRKARVNVSHETREINVIDGQPCELVFFSAPSYQGFPTTRTV